MMLRFSRRGGRSWAYWCGCKYGTCRASRRHNRLAHHRWIVLRHTHSALVAIINAKENAKGKQNDDKGGAGNPRPVPPSRPALRSYGESRRKGSFDHDRWAWRCLVGLLSYALTTVRYLISFLLIGGSALTNSHIGKVPRKVPQLPVRNQRHSCGPSARLFLHCCNVEDGGKRMHKLGRTNPSRFFAMKRRILVGAATLIVLLVSWSLGAPSLAQMPNLTPQGSWTMRAPLSERARRGGCRRT